jgi:hypothetical protein
MLPKAERISLVSFAVAAVSLIVSIVSASIAYWQSQIASQQFALAAQQLRPYVKYIPAFLAEKHQIGILMRLEDLSPLPATVVYTQVTGWVDHTHLGIDFHSTASDLLYQHKGGGSALPPIRGDLFRWVTSGDSIFSLGVCTLYASTAKSDSRLWLFRAVYEYQPGLSEPLTRYIDEREVPAGTQNCSAKDVEDHLYAKQRKG